MNTKNPKIVRCAIYTRKSTEEGLDKEFNSLDAQREAAQAFIASQQHEGWTCLPDPYEDGGFTGGNMERPALQRLLADIAAGHIDCVVVYKVDRLSRSLLDFARMMALFDKHRISFVSVTQQFNTATSMGRLILHVLLSFAQFEREIISERTRDKIAAARRKGKWSGGLPLLGYDVEAQTSKLTVNISEADLVRNMFGLYLHCQTLGSTVQELKRRGWQNKRWVTRKGHVRGGRPFTKTSLHKLLTNIVYTGRVKYKTEVHQGEHAGIVDETFWQQVQEQLRCQSQTQRMLVRNTEGALLKSLLYCAPCGCRMTPTHAKKSGRNSYRYYVCVNALRGGSCPRKSVAAPPLEQTVLDQLKDLESDPLQAFFQEGWEALPALEQTRVVRLLVERIDFDGTTGKLAIALHPGGIQRLAEELEENHHDVANKN